MRINIRNLIIVLVLGSLSVEAQNNTASPYSIRAIGEEEFFGTAFARSLGYAVNGIRTKRAISYSNPASLGSMEGTMMNFGFRGDYGKLENESGINTFNSGNFNYFSLSFPGYRKKTYRYDTAGVQNSAATRLLTDYTNIWNISFGFNPYSSINAVFSNIRDTTYGQLGNIYLRKGGLSRLYLMNAVNITPNLSLGININYIFGQSNSFNEYYLIDTQNARKTTDNRNLRMNGFKFDFGIQGEKNFKLYRSIASNLDTIAGLKTARQSRPLRLVYGATFNNEAVLRYNQIRQILNTSTLFSNAEIDTILYDENLKGRTNLPSGFSAGFSLTYNNKWMICADYKSDLWGNISKNYFTDSFGNSRQWNVGIAYRPDVDVAYMRTRKPNFEYRLGYRQFTSAYNFLDNTGKVSPVKEYGINFGIGIPRLIQNWDGNKVVKSMVNITGEYIRRGSIENGMVRESLYRLTIGFSISDIWFKQRKFQ